MGSTSNQQRFLLGKCWEGLMFQPCHSCHDVPHQDVDGDGTSMKLEEAFLFSGGVLGLLAL